jgi:Lamin Tail Domain
MTGSETVVLENTSTGTLNLSNYLIEYFNKSSPTSLSVPTSTQQLPSFNLPSYQAILFSSDSSMTCGAAAVANEAFTMSDTAGYVMVARTSSQSDGSLLTTPQDHVSWTSSTSGADLLRVPSNTADPNAVWYRNLATGAWQQAELNGCSTLQSLLTSATDATFVQWADGSEPPAIILATASDSSDGSIPGGDIGLNAPQITELLPNPAPPQTDSEDEFIELYNPNDTIFDLSGFKLSVGTTSTRSYTIPSGTTIDARSFRAFFSIDTNLALSNSGGQVRLLDPLGTVISQSSVYSAAKDGQSWALANGQWYWTAALTPNAANIINQSSAAKSSKTSKGSVKSASTSSLGGNSLTPTSSAATPVSVHPWTLAGVGSMALLYAAYEYRVDLANRYDQLRRYAAARRTAGK